MVVGVIYLNCAWTSCSVLTVGKEKAT